MYAANYTQRLSDRELNAIDGYWRQVQFDKAWCNARLRGGMTGSLLQTQAEKNLIWENTTKRFQSFLVALAAHFKADRNLLRHDLKNEIKFFNQICPPQTIGVYEFQQKALRSSHDLSNGLFDDLAMSELRKNREAAWRGEIDTLIDYVILS